MLISSEDVYNASDNALIVGHTDWKQALVLEKQEGNTIDDSRLIDGIWVYPIDAELKHKAGYRTSLDIFPGDWTVLRGAYCNGKPIQTRDCPGTIFYFYRNE